jgi:cellulose synthase (UDP-forming)
MPSTEQLLQPVLRPWQQAALLGQVLVWAVATGLFWAWWLQPSHWAGPLGMALNTVLLVAITGMPAWAYFFWVRMQRVNPHSPFPSNLRLGMVVTKAPSEPWPLVRETLEAMLAQEPVHDTWLADEDPSEEVLHWCAAHRVQISTRRDDPKYHNPTWPRRRKCKEGNLAYFYDHYGYENYDVVVQLDADHRPEPGYLEKMVHPFVDPQVGYVAAPSICDRNAITSWVARGRLYSEAGLHGPQQLGHNSGYAPLCFGSHYALRMEALEQIGGLGPELAEDHSTTLLLNSKGWRGVFACDARCRGLGPETFEDAMVQEFQWSRSLTTILLELTPRVSADLPSHLRCQFLSSELFYPLRGSLSVVGVLLPAVAMATAHPWVRVDYPLFLFLWFLHSLLSILPVYWLKYLGVLNPSSTPLLSWEHMLFEITRGPWVLAGVIAACMDRISRGVHDFRITSKQQHRRPLNLTFIAPHLVLACIGALTALLLGHSAGEAKGYVLLVLISASCSVAAALFALGLDHRLKRLSLSQLGHHYGIVLGAVALLFFTVLVRHEELRSPLQLTEALLTTQLWRP